MPVGDAGDMLARLKAVLPAGWFPITGAGQSSVTPILDGILSGIAWPLSWAYSLLQYVQQQQRIRTATDVWLDVISNDFFGASLPRKPGEGDVAFQARILAALLPDGGTRAALIAKLTQLTGHAPVVFEPRRPADTGAYNVGSSLGYGVAGGYGSLKLGFQGFVTAFRASGGGIAGVGGYYYGSGIGLGGYGVGALQYVGLSMVQGEITDADIQNAVTEVIPEGTLAWMNITTAPT